MKIIIAVIFLFLFSVNVIYAEEDSENLPVLKDSNFIVEKFITGLSWPTTFDFIGDDIIVLEKEGNVRLIKNDQLVIDPILNIEVKTGLEDGLLGILVKDEQVYLHYTTEESGKSTNWFYKYTWNGKILQNKELIKKISGETWHNSGVMTVLDNKVVMVIGDLFNREGITQNFFDGEFDHTSVIMPIDPEGEPIAIGIRNSFGLAVDKKTNFLWDTENGDYDFDEINLVLPKSNSGWKVVQGPATVEQKEELKKNLDYEYSDPEFSWERPIGITSIHFINSPYFSEYMDSVFVGAFHNGNLYKFELNTNRDGFVFENPELQDLVLNISDNYSEIVFGTGFRAITDIKEGPDGLIYVLSIGDGSIYRILPNISKDTVFPDCENDIEIKQILKNCDFSGLDLSNMDLSNKDLSFSNFENSNLKNVNFKNSVIVNANFRNTTIENTNFSYTNLESSLFDEIAIINSNFSDSNLINSNFLNTKIENTNFENSKMKAIQFSMSDIINSNFSAADIYDGDFSNAIIKNSDFSSTILDLVYLDNIEGENIDFQKSRMWKTKFDSSEFSNSDFRNSDNYRSTYLNSNLENVNFQNSRLSHVDFSNSNLIGIDLLGVYPISSIFDNVKFDSDSKINTCLEHDLLSRILNNIFRSTNINDDDNIISKILLGFCN